MEFGLSEEQVALQDSVHRFLSDQVPLAKVRQFADQSNPDKQIWSSLCELGLGGILIPEDKGGTGLSGMDATVIAECLGYHATPAPFLCSAIMAPLALLSSNKYDDQLADMARGKYTIGVAFAELMGTGTRSNLEWNNSKLTGTSAFVLDFNADAYLIATAKRELVLVSAHAPGITELEIPNIDKTRRLGELKFNNTPAECISKDPELLQTILSAGRIILAADALGAAQYMLDQAVQYASEREQFGRVIASFQAVKHMCAEMAAQLEPCRAMLWYAGHTLKELPEKVQLSACHTKAHLSEVSQFVAKTATEVHGGMGFTDLLGLHFWFKRIGYNRQILGSPERLREEAARLQGL